jgi:uncharacterized protein YueI
MWLDEDFSVVNEVKIETILIIFLHCSKAVIKHLRRINVSSCGDDGVHDESEGFCLTSSLGYVRVLWFLVV